MQKISELIKKYSLTIAITACCVFVVASGFVCCAFIVKNGEIKKMNKSTSSSEISDEAIAVLDSVFSEDIAESEEAVSEAPVVIPEVVVAKLNSKEDINNTKVKKDESVQKAESYTVAEASQKLDVSAFKGGTQGIDVSSHQGKIDWAKVAKSDIKFAMIRCGYRGYGSGKIVEDTYFERNAEGAYKNGIAVGIYFYSTAINEAEAREEAAYVCELIMRMRKKGVAIKLPVAYDFEEFYAKSNGDTSRADSIAKNKDVISANAAAYLDYVKSQGYTPLLYASRYAAYTYFDMAKLSKYDFWLAHYTQNGEKSNYNGAYAMWQYTSSGSVSGISGNVDLNFCDYSVNEENAYLCTNAETVLLKEPSKSSETALTAPSGSVLHSSGLLKNGFYVVNIGDSKYYVDKSTVYKTVPVEISERKTVCEKTALYSECIENEKYLVAEVDENETLSLSGDFCGLWYLTEYQGKTVFVKHFEEKAEESSEESEASEESSSSEEALNEEKTVID